MARTHPAVCPLVFLYPDWQKVELDLQNCTGWNWNEINTNENHKQTNTQTHKQTHKQTNIKDENTAAYYSNLQNSKTMGCKDNVGISLKDIELNQHLPDNKILKSPLPSTPCHVYTLKCIVPTPTPLSPSPPLLHPHPPTPCITLPSPWGLSMGFYGTSLAVCDCLHDHIFMSWLQDYNAPIKISIYISPF